MEAKGKETYHMQHSHLGGGQAALSLARRRVCKGWAMSLDCHRLYLQGLCRCPWGIHLDREEGLWIIYPSPVPGTGTPLEQLGLRPGFKALWSSPHQVHYISSVTSISSIKERQDHRPNPSSPNYSVRNLKPGAFDLG